MSLFRPNYPIAKDLPKLGNSIAKPPTEFMMNVIVFILFRLAKEWFKGLALEACAHA